MNYLIAAIVYVLSVLAARFAIMAITDRKDERDTTAFITCVIPLLNTVFVFVTIVVALVMHLEPLTKNAADWFFNKK